MPKSRGRKPKKPRAPTKGAPKQLIAHNAPKRELPIPAQTEQTLDRLPFEEPVHRHDAAALTVGLPEGGQLPHALALGVDRLAAALRIIAPIRDQAPTQRVERYLAGLVIAADDQQVLAGRGVPARRIIVDAAVAHVHAIDDGIPKRSAALDDPPAHGLHIVTSQRRASAGIWTGYLVGSISNWNAS